MGVALLEINTYIRIDRKKPSPMVRRHCTPQGVWPFVLSSYVGCVTAVLSQPMLPGWGVYLARVGLLLIAPGVEPGALKLVSIVA